MTRRAGSRDLGRFDTRPFAAQALVRAVADDLTAAPRRVIDLGAGGGALSLAARRAWPDAEIVALDVDPDAAPPEAAMARRTVADAIGDDLSSLGVFDVVLCNPPYLPLPPGHPAHDALAAAGIVVRGRASGMEAAFVLRATDLAAPCGRIGLVLPEAAASGEAYRGLRDFLVARHRLDRVIGLPRGAFAGADPSARLMVAARDAGAASEIRLGQVRSDGTVDDGRTIPAASAVVRCDAPAGGAGPTLASIGADLVRGTLCPGRARLARISCVHTTDLPERGSRIVLPATAPVPGLSLARPGDILLARIGRNLHLKVGLVVAGEAPFTDCVFRLRVPEEHRLPVLATLVAADGERLRLAARGTGTRHLVRGDVLDIPLCRT